MNDQAVDVLIIGAGPGGLSAARELAQAGRDVLILEKGEVLGRKVCAGYMPLNKEVRIMGIPEDLFRSKIDSVTIFMKRKSHRLELANEPRVSFSREELGSWMASQACEAGARIRMGARVVKIEDERVVTEEGEPIYFKTLIGADGSLSIVRRHLGLPFGLRGVAIQTALKMDLDHILLKFDFKKIGIWPAYAIPSGDLVYCGLGGDLKRYPASGMKRALDEWVREIGYKGEYKKEGFPLCIHYCGHHFGDKWLVGDAAGLINDVSGYGIFPAYLSGREVAKKILDPKYDTPHLNELIRSKKVQGLTMKSMASIPYLAPVVYESMFSLMKAQRIKDSFFSNISAGSDKMNQKRAQ